MGVPLRLLLIEDSEDDATLVVRELRRGNYDVDFQRVDSPDEIESSMRKADWDLIISDYSMPLYSGTEALKLARNLGLDTPFLFVSGTIGEDTAVAALKLGAQDYIMKGNLKRLLPAVHRELNEIRQRREKKVLERQVSQLQKFEAVGRLAGGIAHDFNNVLGAILGWAQLGYDEAGTSAALRQRFEKIIEQGRYASSLTSQLLAFARRQVLQPKKINLNKLLEETLGLLHRVIGENIQIKIDLDQDLRVVSADYTQFEQVLMNLCLNARDAMPDGGQISVTTRNTELHENASQIHADARPGAYVQITVSDTGLGIDPVALEHIFEPFFTTKGQGEGTGLGLATVYGIVRQHNGFLTVRSTVGQGTTFDIYVPVVDGPADILPVDGENTVHGGTETILLAEDHDGLREVAYEVLSGLGYTVILARNGEEAVTKFREHMKDVKLVLLDAVMPIIDGPQAYFHMRDLREDIPVIFTTGHTAEYKSMTALIEQGAVFLQKPFTPKTLAQTVRNVLDEKAN